MKLPEAAYYILKVFAAIDGEIEPQETNQIYTFLANHFYNGSLEQDEVEYLENQGDVSGYEAIVRIQQASTCFVLEPLEIRQKLLDFVYELICADNKIVPEERSLFTDLAEYLFVDADQYNLSICF